MAQKLSIWASDSALTVRDDVSVKVWHNHNVELMWSRDKLHCAVINDDVVIFDIWVSLGNFSADFTEKAITLLHNIG